VFFNNNLASPTLEALANYVTLLSFRQNLISFYYTHSLIA